MKYAFLYKLHIWNWVVSSDQIVVGPKMWKKSCLHTIYTGVSRTNPGLYEYSIKIQF